MILEGFMEKVTFDLSIDIVWSSLVTQTVESARNVDDPFFDWVIYFSGIEL